MNAATARTVETILDDFTIAYRFAKYSTAAKALRVKRQEDEDRLLGEFYAAMRDLAKQTAYELQDTGMDDDDIMARVQAVVVSA